jgi:acetyl-CoA/propionyl-CoA carboxylase biotin carboxyl carrier protein
VTIGEHVEAGQPLLVVEAMKMEHVVTAPAAGVIAELPVRAGLQVALDQVLAVVTDMGIEAAAGGRA